MPTYLFLNKNTGEEYEQSMSISERDIFLSENPHIEQLVNGAPMLTYRTVTKKPDSEFRDRLKEIKRKHVRSTINTW